jgi:hypothetical protein
MLSMRKSVLFFALAVAAGSVYTGCGGSSSPSASTPTPVPTVAPTPAPTPTPTPTPDPMAGLDEGPVERYDAKLKTLKNDAGQLIEGPPEGAPFATDAEGAIWVRVGDVLLFDSSPKNGYGRPCKYKGTPAWYTEDDRGIFEERSVENPFLYKVKVNRWGVSYLWAQLDGVKSNVIGIHAE